MEKLLFLGSGSLVLLFNIYLFSLVGYFVKFPISIINFFLALVATFGWYYFFKRQKLFILSVSIFLLTVLFGGLFIDTSYDGQSYHLGKVSVLENGWNPIYDNILLKEGFTSLNKDFIQAYPTLNSFWSLNIFKLTGNVESAKGVTLFLLLLSMLFAYIALSQILESRILRSLLVVIIAANPVNLVQIFTFGLDSQFYSLFVIFLSLVFLILRRYYQNLNYINLFIVIVFIANNKLTSLVYLCVFLLFFLLYEFNFKKLIIVLSFLMSSVFVFGYQPYVTNLEYFDDMFYPTFNFDYSMNRPSNLKHENQIVLFIETLFMESNSEFYPPKDKGVFKIPFTYNDTEYNSFVYLGPKVGGFGVYFSGIILLLIILLISIIFQYMYNRFYTVTKKTFWIYCLVILLLLLTTLMNPLNNSARYIPQFWLLIPVILLFSFRFRGAEVFVLNILVVFFTFLNSYSVLETAFLKNLQMSQSLETRLRYLAEYSIQDPIKVNFGHSDGNIFLLRKFGVRYSIGQPLLKCEKKESQFSLLNGVGNSEAVTCLKYTFP